jgi:hypothetical protein
MSRDIQNFGQWIVVTILIDSWWTLSQTSIPSSTLWDSVHGRS